MNMSVQISLQDPTFNYFGYIHRIGVAESCDTFTFIFLMNCHLFSTAAITLYGPTISAHTNFSMLNFSMSNFSMSTSTHWSTFFFLDSSHPNGCVIESHLVLNCIFLTSNDIEHLFMCILNTYLSCLKKISTQVLSHVINKFHLFIFK